MSKENVLKCIFHSIENTTNYYPSPVDENKILLDLFEYEFDINLFLFVIDLDFWVNLEQVYGDKLLTTPVYEIAEYLEKHEAK